MTGAHTIEPARHHMFAADPSHEGVRDAAHTRPRRPRETVHTHRHPGALMTEIHTCAPDRRGSGARYSNGIHAEVTTRSSRQRRQHSAPEPTRHPSALSAGIHRGTAPTGVSRPIVHPGPHACRNECESAHARDLPATERCPSSAGRYRPNITVGRLNRMNVTFGWSGGALSRRSSDFGGLA